MERKLIDYLPYQVREFKEYQGITTGEQPEFELAWNHYEEVFDNQFIDTAGNYGLSRWEKMLGITPKATDSLEIRRVRIKTRLNNFPPYTIRAFLRMVEQIANGEHFEVYLDPGTYLMRFELQWGISGKSEALEYLIDEILPENIAIDSRNEIPCIAEGMLCVAGGACLVDTFFITNDAVDHYMITGPGFIGGGTIGVEKFLITNDSKERVQVTGSVSARGVAFHAVCQTITNDSEEAFTVEGAARSSGGAVNSVFVMLTNDFQQNFTITSPGKTGGGAITTEIIKANSEEERNGL